MRGRRQRCHRTRLCRKSRRDEGHAQSVGLRGQVSKRVQQRLGGRETYISSRVQYVLDDLSHVNFSAARGDNTRCTLRGTTSSRLIAPTLGRMPYKPFAPAGPRILPPVSGRRDISICNRKISRAQKHTRADSNVDEIVRRHSRACARRRTRRLTISITAGDEGCMVVDPILFTPIIVSTMFWSKGNSRLTAVARSPFANWTVFVTPTMFAPTSIRRETAGPVALRGG